MPRAVTFDQTGGPEVLQITDQPARDPGPGEVRVRIEASGVNRLDALVRAGTAPRPIQLPGARLGVEGTGVIDAVGADVDTPTVGDPVILAALPDFDTNGSYAEYVTVPATRVVPRPAGVDAVTAAALWVGHSTAYGALIETSGLRPADHLLITAASSGVGLAAIQVANQIGAVPIAVTRTPAKRDALLAAGAAAVIAADTDDVAEVTRSLTGGAGADVIIDSVMGPGLSALATAARPGGTVVTVGWLDPRPASFPAVAPLTMHRYMGYAHVLDPVVVRRIAAFLGAGLRSGVITPVIDRTFTLEEIVDAHRHLESGDQVGKLVVTL